MEGKEFMYVICFYWLGERWVELGTNTKGITDASFKRHLRRVGNVTRQLAEKYVERLYNGVTRHSTKPFKFICFTNEELSVKQGIELRPFKQVSKRGVIPRMFMFSEEAGLFGHQVLCLDIDVVITGSLKEIMNYNDLFCTRLGFAGSDKGKLDGDIMSFKACRETENVFWKPFIQDVKQAEKITQGRERFWVRHVATNFADNFDREAPGKIVSYKNTVRRRGLPEGVSIVSCHGHPRPHQINESWIKQHWK